MKKLTRLIPAALAAVVLTLGVSSIFVSGVDSGLPEVTPTDDGLDPGERIMQHVAEMEALYGKTPVYETLPPELRGDFYERACYGATPEQQAAVELIRQADLARGDYMVSQRAVLVAAGKLSEDAPRLTLADVADIAEAYTQDGSYEDVLDPLKASLGAPDREEITSGMPPCQYYYLDDEGTQEFYTVSRAISMYAATDEDGNRFNLCLNGTDENGNYTAHFWDADGTELGTISFTFDEVFDEENPLSPDWNDYLGDVTLINGGSIIGGDPGTNPPPKAGN